MLHSIGMIYIMNEKLYRAFRKDLTHTEFISYINNTWGLKGTVKEIRFYNDVTTR